MAAETNPAVKMNLLSIDGWEKILGQQEKRGAWGAAYWNAVVLKRAAMTRAIPRLIEGAGGAEFTESDTGIMFQDGLGGMFYRSSISLDRHGAAYFVVIPNRAGGVHSVKWVDPSSIVVDFDNAKGILKGFRRVVGKETGAYFEYNEDTGMTESWDGKRLGFVWSLGLNEVGPGYRLEDMVQLPAGLLNSSDAVMKALFDRGAIAQHVVMAPAEPPDKEKERVLSKIRRALFGGTNASNSVEVLSNQLSFEKVGTDPKDLALTEVDDSNMSDVSAVGDLPRMLLDPDVGANRSLLDRVTSNFILNTIVPHCEHIVTGYNKHVMELEGYTIRLNPESMTINQEDEKLRANAFALYVSQGVPHETAAAILGIQVPEGMPLVDDSLVMPEDEPGETLESVDPSNEIDEEGEAKRAESSQFRRWYKKRLGADVGGFSAKYLTHGDKLLIADGVLRLGWSEY